APEIGAQQAPQVIVAQIGPGFPFLRPYPGVDEDGTGHRVLVFRHHGDGRRGIAQPPKNDGAERGNSRPERLESRPYIRLDMLEALKDPFRIAQPAIIEAHGGNAPASQAASQAGKLAIRADAVLRPGDDDQATSCW